MRTFILLAFFSSMVFSQIKSNPDGYIGGFSLHLTPMLSTYHLDHNDFSGQRYAESMHSYKFNYEVMLKVPASEILTLSAFFTRFNQDYSYKRYLPPINDESAIGTVSRYGMTVSYYFNP